jgi:hypothetical protein
MYVLEVLGEIVSQSWQTQKCVLHQKRSQLDACILKLDKCQAELPPHVLQPWRQTARSDGTQTNLIIKSGIKITVLSIHL